MSAANPPISYGKIWVFLVVLVAIGVVGTLLTHTSKTLAVVIIFAAAFVKAGVVLRHYMHVVHQPKMIYAMLAVPLILAVMMVLILIPDIAANSPAHQHGAAPVAAGEHGSAH